MTPSRGHAGAERPLRIVLDTNVMVSALLFGGNAAPLVEQWRCGRLNLLFSRDTLANSTGSRFQSGGSPPLPAGM